MTLSTTFFNIVFLLCFFGAGLYALVILALWLVSHLDK